MKENPKERVIRENLESGIFCCGDIKPEYKEMEIKQNLLQAKEIKEEDEDKDGEYTDYICDSDPYGLRLEEFCN